MRALTTDEVSTIRRLRDGGCLLFALGSFIMMFCAILDLDRAWVFRFAILAHFVLLVAFSAHCVLEKEEKVAKKSTAGKYICIANDDLKE